MTDERITNMEVLNNGLEIEIEGGACGLFANSFAEQFKESGGKNYVELSFYSKDIGKITVTMQRAGKITPGGKVAKMKELISEGKIKEALAI